MSTTLIRPAPDLFLDPVMELISEHTGGHELAEVHDQIRDKILALGELAEVSQHVTGEITVDADWGGKPERMIRFDFYWQAGAQGAELDESPLSECIVAENLEIDFELLAACGMHEHGSSPLTCDVTLNARA